MESIAATQTAFIAIDELSGAGEIGGNDRDLLKTSDHQTAPGRQQPFAAGRIDLTGARLDRDGAGEFHRGPRAQGEPIVTRARNQSDARFPNASMTKA